MIVLENLEKFKEIYRSGRKWNRCLEAIDNLKNMKMGVCYSKGDSLVYRLHEGRHNTEGLFEGHKRYLDVHYYIEGEEMIESAHKAKLNLEKNYKDLHPPDQQKNIKLPKKVF